MKLRKAKQKELYWHRCVSSRCIRSCAFRAEPTNFATNGLHSGVFFSFNPIHSFYDTNQVLTAANASIDTITPINYILVFALSPFYM